MEVIAILVVIIFVLLLAGALVGLAFELLGLVLTGLIVGALGRLVLPGRQQIGLLQTSLIGIAASLLGGVLGDIFDASWLVRFLVAVALAVTAILAHAAGINAWWLTPIAVLAALAWSLRRAVAAQRRSGS